MTKALNERFAERNGEPIDLQGHTVHMSYKREIRAGDCIVVEFLSWTEKRIQGLNLRMRHGVLRANEVESSGISIWLDSAPPIIEVLCVQGEGELMVSNQWRHEDGVEDEWTNNAGVVIEERDDSAVLRFSDGVGEPSFSDLIVELRVASAAPA